ncbi:MAG TPA: hypothetical protein DCK83_02520 [Gallionellaceae bacterium]|nr:hypothetical protein [Gallionellaceae bacterium]
MVLICNLGFNLVIRITIGNQDLNIRIRMRTQLNQRKMSFVLLLNIKCNATFARQFFQQANYKFLLS